MELASTLTACFLHVAYYNHVHVCQKLCQGSVSPYSYGFIIVFYTPPFFNMMLAYPVFSAVATMA